MTPLQVMTELALGRIGGPTAYEAPKTILPGSQASVKEEIQTALERVRL